MSADSLYKKVFEKNGEVNDAAGHLNDLVKEHPYFSLAHFYLLKNTPQTADNYTEVAAKTALHFNNPFLLQQQLENEAADTIDDLEHEPAVDTIPIIEAHDQPAAVQEDVLANSELPAATPATEPEAPPVANVTEPETLQAPMEVAASDTVEPAAEEPLLFEPLHATDYFASQGIKLRDEPLPTDKLGKQLKSFTDWLKTMKKVHETQGPGKDVPVDVAIQQLAEKSNREEAVITEAMAEVYLQQGKQHKAKEIYEKLSLLNPSKSAYFAAKLDQFQ